MQLMPFTAFSQFELQHVLVGTIDRGEARTSTGVAGLVPSSLISLSFWGLRPCPHKKKQFSPLMTYSCRVICSQRSSDD